MRFIVRDAMKGVRSLDKSIRDCEKQILAIIDGDESLKRNYGHIESIPGISIVNAAECDGSEDVTMDDLTALINYLLTSAW